MDELNRLLHENAQLKIAITKKDEHIWSLMTEIKTLRRLIDQLKELNKSVILEYLQKFEKFIQVNLVGF